MRWMSFGVLILAFGPAALAQQSERRIAFDVAAIRPAAPLSEQQVAPGDYTRLGINVFETRIAAGYVSLFELVRTAFDVHPYQIVGPSWLRDPRFDVQATFPPGSGREDVPAMLRTLLEDRFGLVARVETRPVDVYELVVGASDRTLVEVEPSPDLPDVRRLAPGERVGVGGDSAIARDAATGALRVRTRDQALYTLKPSAVRGAAQIDAERMTMQQLASSLRDIVERPVIDRTGLTGAYRFTLEIPSPGAGRGGLTTARDGTPILPEPSGVDMFRSLERLGLKLQAERSPIEMVVIEKIERTPTEN
jgi:uncharacterized protein (TIGR03435 family)